MGGPVLVHDRSGIHVDLPLHLRLKSTHIIKKVLQPFPQNFMIVLSRRVASNGASFRPLVGKLVVMKIVQGTARAFGKTFLGSIRFSDVRSM
jgi:hypothetical protein